MPHNLDYTKVYGISHGSRQPGVQLMAELRQLLANLQLTEARQVLGQLVKSRFIVTMLQDNT